MLRRSPLGGRIAGRRGRSGQQGLAEGRLHGHSLVADGARVVAQVSQLLLLVQGHEGLQLAHGHTVGERGCGGRGHLLMALGQANGLPNNLLLLLLLLVVALVVFLLELSWRLLILQKLLVIKLGGCGGRHVGLT